jgi:hypothetical protein
MFACGVAQDASSSSFSTSLDDPVRRNVEGSKPLLVRGAALTRDNRILKIFIAVLTIVFVALIVALALVASKDCSESRCDGPTLAARDPCGDVMPWSRRWLCVQARAVAVSHRHKVHRSTAGRLPRRSRHRALSVRTLAGIAACWVAAGPASDRLYVWSRGYHVPAVVLERGASRRLSALHLLA